MTNLIEILAIARGVTPAAVEAEHALGAAATAT